MAIRTGQNRKARRGRRVSRAGVLERFYAGVGTPCPVGCGGTAQAVRVSTTPRGGGEVWLECTSCAQRARYEVPPATPAEKRKVTIAAKAGGEPVCPRHAGRVTLRARGRQLFCPECGVVFRE